MSERDPTIPRLLELASAIFAALRLRWRFILSVTATVCALAIVMVLLVPRLYKTDASLTVDSQAGGLASAGVLGLLGRIDGALGGEQSPAFYVQLIESRPILDRLLLTTPSYSCNGQPRGEYLQSLPIDGDSREDSLYAGREVLIERLWADFELETSVIEVTLEAECPLLARELLDSLLLAVNTFNVETRQSRAKSRREFAEGRAAEAETRLQQAEDALERFLTTNRQLGSPALQFERERLERRVSMETELATALMREFESARLEEINSTPSITVLAHPSLPVEPSRPRRRLVVAVASVFGFLVACTLAVFATVTSPLPAGTHPGLERLQRLYDEHLSRRRPTQDR